MTDLVKYLYEKFLMRDLLGKVVPGLLFIFCLSHALEIDPRLFLTKFPIPEWLYGLMIFGISILAGLGLQVIGETLLLVSAHPHPISILWQPRKGREARRLFRKRMSDFSKGQNEAQKEQRERYVYLIEGSGNLSLSFLSASITQLGNPKMAISFIGLFVLFLFVHKIHVSRQAHYEIAIIRGRGEKLKSDYSKRKIRIYVGEEI